MPRILVVEDEPAIADTIDYVLRTDGCTVVRRATLARARTVVAGMDLVVLDVGLPDGSGFDFCRDLRRSSTIPVIFLTARADEVDRVVGLEIGADDYLVKPFSPRELSARVRAVLRRSRITAPVPATTSALDIDAERRRATWQGRPLDLTRYEFRLLQVLAEHPGRPFSRSQLLDLVWDHPEASFDRTVDTHIKQLRAKLKAIGADDEVIETLRGEGYRLKDAP
jgi:two-component system catabolic regulation response regulator CreB